ncbi:MAG: S-layer homology domain-containing protein, partial [Eubacteriales bacterium]
TGYAEAVAALTDLGVMQGPGDGSFNPDGTLRRDEAAVIAAKLVAGAKGQTYDWTSSTCQFADVDAAWSFAYINYVAQRNIMTGDGSGKFNPNGTLQIDEAIALAVKATSATKTAEAVENTKTYKPAYWATYWISAAEELGLLNGIEVFDYEASCSRATMAQIGYNMLSADKISAGFGLEKVTAEVAKVTDVVELSNGKKINADAFNAALKAAGVDASAADLKGCKVTLTWSSLTNAVYGVSVDSVVTVYSYADAKIANVKENNALTNKITVDGITYNVAEKDDTNTDIIGGTTSSKGIVVSVNGETWETAEALPTYYKAVAYDDDADGDCDRLAIATYSIATAKVVETNTKGVVIYETSKGFTNNEEKVDDEKPVVWTGAALVTDNETPMLIADVIALNDAGNAYVADVLEVGAVVTGKLVGIGSNYVNIDGTKYTFVADAAAVESWTLNQTVSIYTIGGQYVKVASASKADIEVVVNSAAVVDGKAVITGYNKSAAYADITITVEGINNGKLVSRAGKQNTAKDSDNKDYNTTVEVGYYKSADEWVKDYALEEGAIISLRQTESGAYINAVKGSIADLGTAADKADKFEVKNGYVYIDGVARMYVASGAVILEEVVDANAKTGSYAVVSYNKLSAFAERKNVNYDYTVNGDGKVDFIYIEAGHEAVTTITKTKTLAEGQAIVFVKDASIVESTYDTTIYNAINLFTGEKIQISTTGSVVAGNYYIINAENAVVEDTTGKWIGNYTVTVEYSGLVGVVKAQAIVKSYNSADKSTTYAQEGDVLTFGLDNITIYNAGVLDADGNVSKANVNDTLMTGETHTVSGDVYVVAGQMIIVLK